MKLNTDLIKFSILSTFPEVDPMSLKRKTKKKTSNGIVRTFDSNIGIFT